MSGKSEKEQRAFCLPEEMTVGEIGGVWQQVMAVMEQTDALTMDLSDVVSCDTAGVQLLLSVKRSAADHACTLTWTALPEAVLIAARRVGMDPDEFPIVK